MGWSLGYDRSWNRDIGYGVPAWCDHPGCGKKIDRGLGCVCGGKPWGGDDGCGLYFCDTHGGSRLCERCEREDERGPFDPTEDPPEWLWHKFTDPSWAEWRNASLQDTHSIASRLRDLIERELRQVDRSYAE